MSKNILVFILTLCLNNSFGQEFTDFYGKYLGQTLPTDTPVVFMPGIISTQNLEHSAATFTPDYDGLYWISKGKLWYMNRKENRWTIPQISDRFGGQIFFMPDGQHVYFQSSKRVAPKQDTLYKGWTKQSNSDLWFVEQTDTGWSEPHLMPSPITTDGFEGLASFTKTGYIYYLGYLPNVEQECGILRAKIENGKFQDPFLLPSNINSKYQDWTPFVSPDDNFLVFSSNRIGGYGNGDLYVSFHDIEKDTWSEPINLGDKINTNKQERFPGISPDGEFMFFTRWTKENNHDIYWVSTDFIERLKINSNDKK